MPPAPKPRALVLLALAAEAAELPLYAKAFGAPVAGLMAVRALLALVLAVFALRDSSVARVVLGALRLMAGLVGIVMATIVDDAPAIAIALGVVSAFDALVGIALILRGDGGVESRAAPLS